VVSRDSSRRRLAKPCAARVCERMVPAGGINVPPAAVSTHTPQVQRPRVGNLLQMLPKATHVVIRIVVLSGALACGLVFTYLLFSGFRTYSFVGGRFTARTLWNQTLTTSSVQINKGAKLWTSSSELVEGPKPYKNYLLTQREVDATEIVHVMNVSNSTIHRKSVLPISIAAFAGCAFLSWLAVAGRWPRH
jgi:hypothetical protein